jgi:hypothetical protein
MRARSGLIFLLLLSFCGADSQNETVEELPTSTTTTTTSTSTTTTLAPTTTSSSTTTTTTSTTTTTTIPIKSLYPTTPPSSTWIKYSGNDEKILDISLGDSLYIAEFSYRGGYLSAQYLDSSKWPAPGKDNLLVNVNYDYFGITKINFGDQKLYPFLEVYTFSDSWELTIKPIASAENFYSDYISGTQDSLFEAYELTTPTKLFIKVENNDFEGFAINQYKCDGSFNGVLYETDIVRSGEFTATNSSETCFIEVKAYGDWAISTSEISTIVTTTTTVPTTETNNEDSQLSDPGDSKNCGDFSNYSEAKAWFDKYYDAYGDIAKLDRDGDLIPCESLPGAP